MCACVCACLRARARYVSKRERNFKTESTRNFPFASQFAVNSCVPHSTTSLSRRVTISGTLSLLPLLVLLQCVKQLPYPALQLLRDAFGLASTVDLRGHISHRHTVTGCCLKG